VELLKDILKIDKNVGKKQIETLVEGEMYLNQSKPDIEKILWADGKVDILSTKIVKDKVMVNGIVYFKVLYSSKEDFSIESLETTQDFKEEIPIEGIDEEMISHIKVYLEHIEHEIVDERKIVLKALVNIDAKVETTETIEIITDIKGKEGLQVQKETVKYNDILATGDSFATVKEAFEIEENLPDVYEIIKIDSRSYETESKVVDDRIIISGILECSIIYYGGNKLNSLKKEISFNHFVEMPGIVRDSKSNLKFNVNNLQYEIKEDIEGDMRIIDLEATIKVGAKVYEQKEKEVVLDAYSIKKKTNIERDEIRVVENIGEFTHKDTINGLIKNNKPFKDIYNIYGRPSIIDSKVMDDKVILEGVLLLNVLYSSEKSKAIESLKEEIPFKFYAEIQGVTKEMEVEVESFLEDVFYRKSDDGKLEIEGLVRNFILVTREKKINVLSKLEETDEIIDKRDRPSITIYMVQVGDTLWDIAKRYNTTTEEIILANAIESPNSLMPGEKIIIEKNVNIDF
jgi:predicted nucleic acid-binding protein